MNLVNSGFGNILLDSDRFCNIRAQAARLTAMSNLPTPFDVDGKRVLLITMCSKNFGKTKPDVIVVEGRGAGREEGF
jgi:hypothetical protein